MADEMNMQIVIEAANETQSGFEGVDSSLNAIQELINNLTKAFDDFSKSISTNMEEASTVIEDLTKPMEEISSQSEAAFTSMADSIKPVEEQAANATKALENMGKAAQASAEEAAASTGAKSSGGSYGGLNGEAMNMMMAGMSLQQIAQPLDNIFKGAIDSFAQFDQSMRLVNEESKLSEGGFKSLESSIVSLSNQTGLSADQLAKGLYNVVATGLTDTTKAMNLLTVAAEGAKAGNTDLDTSTRALDAVMGAYGMTSDKAQHIMDVMFTAVNQGQMHFTDLATSVGASATAAATAGVGYEELAAAQATLTNVGKNAQSASQNLNSLLIGMIAPTAGATKEAKALGIEWDAGALKAHGLTYMINEAVKATGGNEAALKKLVPNQRAYMAVLALGENANKQYTDTLNNMKNANGAASAALTEFNKGAQESIDKMNTSVKNAEMEMVAAFAPAIEKVASFVEGLIKWFDSLSPSTQKVIEVILLATAAFATVGATIATVAAAIMMIAGIIGTAGGIIVLAVAGIAAIVTVVVSYWQPISGFFKTLWNDVSGVFTSTWHGIQKIITDVWNIISPTINNAVKEIQAFWNQVWPQIQQIFTAVWTAMEVILAPIVATLFTIISGELGLIKGIWSESWNVIKDIFKFVWDEVTGIIKIAWDLISGIIKVALDLLTGNFKGAGKDFLSIFTNIGNDIKNLFSNLAKDAVTWGSDMIQGLINGIKGMISGVTNAVSNVANTIKSFLHFSKPDEGPLSDYETWMPDFMLGMADGIESNKSKLINSISGVASMMAQPFTSNLNVMSSVPVMASGSSGGGNTFIIHCSGNITKSEDELADRIKRKLMDSLQGTTKHS